MYGSESDVKNLTGVHYDELGMDDAAALDAVLGQWLEWITSRIDAMLAQAPVEAEDALRDAVDDVAVRTCAKMVAVARQNRTAPVVQINDFAVQIINTADVTADLQDELAPLQRPETDSRLGLFRVGDEIEEEEE